MTGAPGATRGERHLASHIFNIVVFVVGGVALALLMRRLGLEPAEADILVTPGQRAG